ncbi:MAG: 50S ribosomal protein L25, partial [Chloroflexi bacterium]|nr:50S ribosomal protein L25 [Chloroflexota bacterium]
RFLRRRGLTPANLYGTKIDSIALQIQTSHLQQALVQGGRNALLSIKVAGEKDSRAAIIRALQVHPVTDELVHVDFLQVDVTRTISAEIPVVLVGESPLPKGQTLITQAISSVQVEGLPMDIPRSVEVDISILIEIDQSIWVRDLQLPPNIEVLTDPDQLVVKAALARVVEEEVEEVEEAEEGVEGEAVEGVEGEAPAAGETQSPQGSE